jgi:hypothetical protein
MTAAPERAGHSALNLRPGRVALGLTRCCRSPETWPYYYLLISALVGSSFLALWSVLVCLRFLVVLDFVAIGLSPVRLHCGRGKHPPVRLRPSPALLRGQLAASSRAELYGPRMTLIFLVQLTGQDRTQQF